MKKKRIITFLLSFCVLGAVAQNRQVREGNKLYEQKKYKEATAAYQKALAKDPTNTPGMFNLGNALFQQKNFDASRQVMSNTVKQSKDKFVKADAHYNIGNTYMQEQKWDEAINAYKQTLRNNPQDEAAKYNLSYALAMKKKQDGGGGGKNNDKNKDQNKQDQNKDNKQGDKNKDQQNKDQQDKSDENKDQENKNKDQKDDQQKQPQPSKLTEQQADQLLNALSQEEKKLHDKKEKGKAIPVKVEKDW